MVRVLYFTLLLTLHLLVPTQGGPGNTAVFDNSIQGSWQDWGFSSTIDTAGNSMSNMITARVNYNYGLYFRNPTGIPSTNYAIEFEYQLVNIGTNNRDLSVDLYGPTSHTDQYVWRTSFSTANFDTWYNVTLPFANFVRVQDGYDYNSPAALPTTIYGFTLKQAWVQPTEYGDPADPSERGVLIKRISIKPSSSSVYSYVVYNAPAVSVGEMIYQQSTGGLKSGWLDWSASWSAGNASATSSAASLTVNKNFYNGLYFSCVRNFDINRLATISYRVKVVNRVTAHGLGQYKVVFYDTSSPPAPIGDGYIVRSNSGTSYVNKTHPISIFNIPLGTMISGVAFMGVGRSSATFNFDEVKIGIPPSAGLSSDPIIDGFNGEKFDFKGVPKRIFNILSMPDLQINSFFIAGLNANETYSGAIGIKQSDSSFISFDLWGARLHQTNTTASGERPVIKEIHYPLRNFEIPNGGLISRPSAGRMIIDWPLYSITLVRMWERHGDQEITYIDISVSLRIGNLDQKNIHGVLGQTYHRSWTATNETYVGTWEDYAAPAGTLDLFTDNFPQQYFKYNPNNQISHVAGESKSGGAVGKR